MRFRLLRRRLTISAPRMAVRSAMPWPLRWAVVAIVLGFCAAIGLWAFEFGKGIAERFLIPYNENPAREIRRPTDARVYDFQTVLVQAGVQCSVRSTRGIDISAACGQLGKADPRSATDWFARVRAQPGA